MLDLFSSTQDVTVLTNPLAAGDVLTETEVGGSMYPSLLAIDVGEDLYPSGVAPGRRVQLPWGNSDFDINSLTADGRLLMQRAIGWAGNVSPV